MKTEHASILKIATSSLQFTLRNPLTLLKYWSIPFVFSVLFYMLTVGLVSLLPNNPFVGFLATVMLIVNIAASLVTGSWWIPKWVQFHDNGKKSTVFSYKSDSILYLRKITIFTVGVFLAALMMGFVIGLTRAFSSTIIHGLISALLIGGLLYLCYRFSFPMPAAALGKNLTFKDSWQKSATGSWKFLGLVLILGILVNMPLIVIALLAYCLKMIHIGGIASIFFLITGAVVFLTNIVFLGAFPLAWTSYYKRLS